ncbi:MAG: hypothetical protein ACYS30_23830 [Planctomycetota bacterium]
MSALIAEALVVALLLNKQKFDFVRVLFVWIVVTLVTYWLFVAMLIPTFLLGEKLQPSVSQFVWITLMVLLVLIAEVIIILLEARIIRTLSRRSFFRKVGPYGFSKRQSIVVSVVGNMSSVVVGLFLLGL